IHSRFEALHPDILPLVGRTEELALLLRRWEQAKAGEGCAVLVTGEPGIGKSRLVVALERRISPAPSARIRFLCSPHHQDSPLYPIIRQVERAADFEGGDLPEAKLKKLVRLLETDVPSNPD